MRMNNFQKAAKQIANKKETFCCLALPKDSWEYEKFKNWMDPEIFNNDEQESEPWWKNVDGYDRLARTLALLFVSEVIKSGDDY